MKIFFEPSENSENSPPAILGRTVMVPLLPFRPYYRRFANTFISCSCDFPCFSNFCGRSGYLPRILVLPNSGAHRNRARELPSVSMRWFFVTRYVPITGIVDASTSLSDVSPHEWRMVYVTPTWQGINLFMWRYLPRDCCFRNLFTLVQKRPSECQISWTISLNCGQRCNRGWRKLGQSPPLPVRACHIFFFQ